MLMQVDEKRRHQVAADVRRRTFDVCRVPLRYLGGYKLCGLAPAV